jgi:hypothetical protein
MTIAKIIQLVIAIALLTSCWLYAQENPGKGTEQSCREFVQQF